MRQLPSKSPCSRFPWVYFIASLLPIALITNIHVLPKMIGPQDAMGPAMVCSLMMGPVSALVVGWGFVRLWRGDGNQYPALRWLIWLPGLFLIAGLALG